jgi:hypothetical protein
MYYTTVKGLFRGAKVAMWWSIVAKKWKLRLWSFYMLGFNRYLASIEFGRINK